MLLGLSCAATASPVITPKIKSPLPTVDITIKTPSGETTTTQYEMPLDLQARYSLQPMDYIIQLKAEPLLVKKQQLVAQSKANSANRQAGVQYATQLKQYSQDLQSRQQQLAQSWLAGKKIAGVVDQHHRVLNALVVKATFGQVQALKKHPEVMRVDLSKPVEAFLAESVPLIKAPNVWEQQDRQFRKITGKDVTVAILDTGIDYTHPDLGGCLGSDCKVIGGYDFINDDADPMDDHVHGTHVAGIVAGKGEITGVAPDANLLAVKVLAADGAGETAGIIAGIEYAVDPDGDPLTDDGADVINMSLGGGGSHDGPMSVAVNNAVQAGTVVVVAAGNGGQYGDIRNTSPASAELAITVASSDKSDYVSSFSSKGAAEAGHGFKPEIIAPGSLIRSSVLEQGYDSFSGTSMAAPHVAGAVALLKQRYPDASAASLKNRLTSSGVDLELDPLTQGAGRLDVSAALNAQILVGQAGLNFGRVGNGVIRRGKVVRR